MRRFRKTKLDLKNVAISLDVVTIVKKHVFAQRRKQKKYGENVTISLDVVTIQKTALQNKSGKVEKTLCPYMFQSFRCGGQKRSRMLRKTTTTNT